MVSLLLSDDDFFALMDIYTLLGGLTVKFPSSKIIPCIRHHTSSIRHRLDSCGIFAVNPLEMLTGGPPVSKTPNLPLVLRPLFIEVCGIFSWRLGQDCVPLSFGQDRLHLGNKNKKTFFYFVFRSICTTFAHKSVRNCSRSLQAEMYKRTIMASVTSIPKPAQIIITLEDNALVADIKRALKMIRGVASVRVAKVDDDKTITPAMRQSINKARREYAKGETITCRTPEEMQKYFDSL